MREFERKYGCTATQYTARMAAEVSAIAARQAEHDASLVRAGAVDTARCRPLVVYGA